MEEDDKITLIPPIKIGDILKDQKVINTGKKNDGVVKYENYIIFVEGAETGQTIDIEMVKILPKFGLAKIVNDK